MPGTILRAMFLVVVSAGMSAGAVEGTLSAQTAAGTRAIADCLGKPVAHPDEIVLACATANTTAYGLRWVGWGEPMAVATGHEGYNDCSPDCVSGHVRSIPIALVVSGQQRCPDGERAYGQIVVVGNGAGSALQPIRRPCLQPPPALR
jgi:hypothetical protein